MKTIDPETVREHVRARYGDIAQDSGGCCGTTASSCCGRNESYDQQLGYSAAEVAAVPTGSNLGLGCGNPTAIASIRPGETALDLGSGAGFDCFLAARQLAGTGRVIGVDMTPAMVTKARANARRGGHTNVEFRLGEIEALPVPDQAVDLVIFQLRDQSLPGKAPGLCRGVSRAETRRAAGDRRHHRHSSVAGESPGRDGRHLRLRRRGSARR